MNALPIKREEVRGNDAARRRTDRREFNGSENDTYLPGRESIPFRRLGLTTGGEHLLVPR